MQTIPEPYHDLLRNDRPDTYGVLNTLSPAGQPMAMPVWFVTDDEFFYISTGRNTVKTRNVRANPNVSFVILAEDQHLRYIEVRGEIIDIISEGSYPLRNQVEGKYTGRTANPEADDVILKLQPRKVFAFDYSDYVEGDTAP